MPELTSIQQQQCAAVINTLQQHQSEIRPLLREPYLGTEPVWFDFSANNPEIRGIDMAQPMQLQNYVASILASSGKSFGIGRYDEDRVLYQQSSLFQNGQDEPRSVHLAYDVWVPIGTPLYAPLPAKIHSLQNNDKFLDYGATIILEHTLDGVQFYSLYGHLSLDSLQGKTAGQEVAAGEVFARVGNITENGQWAPHVHAEIISDLLGNIGDFPGVVKPSERSYYTTLCPNPALLFKF